MAPSPWRAATSRSFWSTGSACRSSRALPLAFLLTALVGVALERTLYVHVYAKTHLEQVLFSIGLVFMSVAAVDYVMGSQQQFVSIPSYLQGQINLFGVGIGRYRLLIIVICGLLTVALQFSLMRTRASARACAPRSTTRASRAGSASTSTRCSPSPSRSARGLPASAARSAPKSSGSIRTSRSSS